MSHPARRIESFHALTHELVHVEKLIVRLRETPAADARDELLELALDLRDDAARRLRSFERPAVQ